MFSCRFGCSITHNLFLFNVLAGPLVTEKDLNAGHTEASETVGMCRIRIIHYDWHSNSVLYIYIYIYIYTVPSTNIGTLDKYEQRRL